MRLCFVREKKQKTKQKTKTTGNGMRYGTVMTRRLSDSTVVFHDVHAVLSEEEMLLVPRLKSVLSLFRVALSWHTRKMTGFPFRVGSVVL